MVFWPFAALAACSRRNPLPVGFAGGKLRSGSRLVARLCKEAKANGCARIDWIVAANNDNGRGFYERMGATVFESVRLARIDQNAILAHTSDA